MSICVVDGRQCCCQPEEGFPCPGVVQLRAMLANSTWDEDPPLKGFKAINNDEYWKQYKECLGVKPGEKL